MSRDFWSVVFNGDEQRCLAYRTSGTEVRYLSEWEPDSERVFFSINPLHTDRRDSNVTCHRNILCEFDKGTIKEQLRLVEDSKIPYTSIVFSGNKSIHVIISLEEPCKNREEYNELVKRIYRKLPGVDTSCSNPSRFSRTPGALRSDTGQHQTLIELKSRVPREELEHWLGPLPPKAGKSVLLGTRLLPVWVKAFLEYGAAKGGRNRMLFVVACEMFRQGYNEEEIISMQTVDLSQKEIKQTVASARKSVENNT